MEALKGMITGMQAAMKAKTDDQFNTVKKTVEGLAATVDDLAATVVELSNGSGAGAVMEEDALSDRIEGLVIQHVRAPLESILEQTRAETKVVLESATALAQSGMQATQLASAVIPGKRILSAIREVMRAVTYVPKAGDYEGGKSGNYKFRKFDDTAAAIGKAFRDHGVFMQTFTKDRTIESYDKPFANGGSARWTDVYVEVQFVLTSLEDGSTLTMESYGQGKDNSDKATAKAMTMALKTALTQAFMIPTDEPDPDSERPGDRDDYGPPVGSGQRAPERQQEQPPAPQQSQQAQRQASPKGTPEQRAQEGLAAARAMGMTRAKLSGIVNYATEQGLADVPVTSAGTTQPLRLWLLAIRSELPED
jgi:hypothetical protein